jgi:hypothetical protein
MNKQPYKSSPLHCTFVQPRIFHNIIIIHIPEQSHYTLVNILWLSTIAYATFQATPNFFQFVWLFLGILKKMFINCGNRKWATNFFSVATMAIQNCHDHFCFWLLIMYWLNPLLITMHNKNNSNVMKIFLASILMDGHCRDAWCKMDVSCLF